MGVQSRLKNRNYPTIQKFVDDVNAIFDNAMYYNEEHSQVWEDAAALKVPFPPFTLPLSKRADE